jgi:hypothetical protein
MVVPDLRVNVVPKLTIKKDYILVEPQENDYWEIWETAGRLLKIPEYPDKNAIWVFQDRPINIEYADLYKLQEFIKKNYPEGATRSKTAIVVTSELHTSLAELFAQIAKDLPYEIRVFSDMQAAEDWVIK